MMLKNKKNEAALLLAPMLILLGIIVIYPMLYSFYMSFQYYVLTDKANAGFVGFDNYMKVLTDPTFIVALKNTVKWVAGALSAQFIVGLLFACMLNREFKGRGIIRSISLLPWVTPGVVIALMWGLIYDGNLGVLNDILKKIGFIKQNIPWLAQPQTSLTAQTVSIIWQGIPFFTIMILAAMQGISTELYESATVDGAGEWQKFRYVTWPHILPTIIITVFLRIVWITNNTEIIYIMTQGGPGDSSLTVSVYTYMQAQKSMNFGYASALAVVMTIILSGFMILYIGLLDRNGQVMEE